MAVVLNVTLTDAEQAVVSNIAQKVAPGATAAQVKAWAEKQCKIGLHAAVMRQFAEFEEIEDRAGRIARENEANEARLARAAETATGFPDPTSAG